MLKCSTSIPVRPESNTELNGRVQQEANTLTLTNEQRLAKITWPEADTPYFATQPLPANDANNANLRNPELELLYTSPMEDELKTAIAFLTNTYTQGSFETTYVGERQGILATWSNNGQSINLLHNFTTQNLETDSLKTDGIMLTYIQNETETQLCYSGGKTIRVRQTDSQKPRTITLDTFPLEQSSWQFAGEWLTISLNNQPTTGCLQLHN